MKIMYYIFRMFFCRTIVLAIISVSALSCSKFGKVKITTDENDFPVVNLKNPYGRAIIIISPSSETGSLGFESEGVITWIKGMPVANKPDKLKTDYTWTVSSGNKFILSVAENKNGFDLTMKTEGIKPSKYLLNINSIDNEYFTGIFERVVDGPQTLSWREDITTALNLRGEKTTMKLVPTTSAYAPFYISSENYSFFVHGTWPGTFDFCKQYPDAVQVSFEGPELNVNLSVASTPKELVQKHALEIGPSFQPPDWALGPWRWRDEHFNTGKYYDGTEAKTPFNSDLVEDILLMKYYDIPSTAYWIDRPWAKGYFGYEDFEFDTVKFPQPENMIKWVNSHNMELMLWIAPFVCGEQAVYAKEKGYELIALTPDKRRPGMFPGIPGPGVPGATGNRGRMPGALPERMQVNIFGGASARPDAQGVMELIDFTNPEAARWWGENGPAKLAKMGIKGFKLDRADGEMELDSLHLLTDSGRSYRENYNDYPHQFIKATYDAVKPVLGDDFILFPRGVYTGSARYGAMWAGDIRGEPYAFRAALIALQRCAIMGYPLWGSDIGGYRGFKREICMKWLGFGCFSPIMEVGPTEDRGFWNVNGTPSYDEELIATWRLYTKTRMKILPYIKELVLEANKEGTPVARPLFIEYPEQKESWNDWQTYLFGKDILVSVIWEEGKFEKDVFLPEGETWIDAWNNKEYKGGQYFKVKTESYQIPLFIRKGSAIDLGDLNALYKESLSMAGVKANMTDLEAAEGWK